MKTTTVPRFHILWLLPALLGLLATPLCAEQFGLFTYRVESNNTVTITDYPEDATGEAVIPAEIDGKPVTSIGWDAFSRCTGLTSVTISSGVTSIGGNAFYRCTGLTSVTISSGVTSIGQWAFSGCTGLRSAIFVGAAPSVGHPLFLPSFDNDAEITFYFFSGNTGFTTPTWQGHPAVEIDLAATPAAPWLLEHGLAHDADLQQDLNGDGVSLLAAYALDLDPSRNLAGSLPAPFVDGGSLALSFHAASPGITYTAQTSTDLEHWTEDGVSYSEPGADGQRTASIPIDGPQRFLRLVLAD